MRGRGDRLAGWIWGGPAIAGVVGGVAIGALLATLVVGGRPPEPSVDRSREATITRSLPARPAVPAALGPEATVRRFYGRLGERRFEALYALVGEDFRARAPLAEYAARRRELQRVEVRSVSVQRLAEDRAGADIDVILVEPDGRERCTGRLALTQTRGRWRIDPGTVTCR